MLRVNAGVGGIDIAVARVGEASVEDVRVQEVESGGGPRKVLH